jgi:hypothetical protein
MSKSDMFNREKDLISDYLEEYPVIRYIMPSFTHNGKNVSHRLHILRQAYWVLVQILKADDANKVLADSSKFDNSNEALDLNLTVNDIKLLSLFLAIAKEKFTDSKDSIIDTISSGKDIIFTGNKTDTNTYDLFLTALEDHTNGLSPKKVMILKKLASNTISTVTSDPKNYDKLSSFIPIESYTKPLFYQVSLDWIFYIKGIKTDKIELTNRSILDPNGNIYIICSLAQNSFTYSMGPAKQNRPNYSFKFEQNANGLFILKKIDTKTNQISEHDFTADFAKLVQGNEYCRFFGAGVATGDEKTNCGVLIASCIGETTHDVKSCRINLLKVDTPTTKFRGWNTLSLDQRRYFAYRILLGLGIPGNWDKNGNLTFIDESGKPIYSIDEIKSFIVDDADNKEKLSKDKNKFTPNAEYVLTLLKTVGTIVTYSRPNVSGRPSMSAISKPSFITINPRMGGNFGLSSFKLFGGANESQFETIQYGGGTADAEKIIASIKQKIDALDKINPRALPSDKKAYINDKISKFYNLAQEIDNYEQLLVSYITIAAQYPTKDIVITEQEIDRFRSESNKKKTAMAQKIQKFDTLQLKLVNFRF